jgi:putative DNA primase/helicase
MPEFYRLPQQDHGNPEQRTVRPYNLEEVLTADIPERDFHLRPAVPTQGLAMVFAPKGHGKTQFSLTCALAMAAGATAITWQAPRASSVLYVDGEMPGDLMKQRIQGLVAGMDVEGINPDCFKLITPDLSGDLPNLATKEGQEVINSMAEDFEVLILDNLSTVLNTGKESGSDEWQAVQDWLLSLRRLGKSVIMVHHAGKSGGQRGASRKEDILDTVVSLTRPKDYQQKEGCRVNVHLDKARGMYGKEVEPFEAKLEQTQEGALYWTWKSLEDAEVTMVGELLDQGLSLNEIATELSLHKSKVQRLKKKAQGK